MREREITARCELNSLQMMKRNWRGKVCEEGLKYEQDFCVLQFANKIIEVDECNKWGVISC